MTAVYGFNDPDGRTSLWNSISSVSRCINSPWIVLGDFNAIRVPGERRGKSSTQANDMDSFNDYLVDSNLLEADYKGMWFTWDNHQLGKDLVLSKIERVFFNQQLLDFFDNVWVDVFSNSVSDHRILVLHVDFVVPKLKIPFQHFNAWASLDGYRNVVDEAWKIELEGCPMYHVVKKLRNVKFALINWNKTENGDMFLKDKLCTLLKMILITILMMRTYRLRFVIADFNLI